MPILPVAHPERFAAVVGVMLYPGVDPIERRRAATWASQYLANPVKAFAEQGGSLAQADLLTLATAPTEILTDLDERWMRGTAMGEMFKTLLALAQQEPPLASWNNAVRIASQFAKTAGAPASRAWLLETKEQFLSVGHLWAAWSMRGGKADLTTADQFVDILLEADDLREWGQNWRAKRDNADTPLGEGAWRLPEEWRLERRPADSQGVCIRGVTLSDELLAPLRPAGRPRRKA